MKTVKRFTVCSAPDDAILMPSGSNILQVFPEASAAGGKFSFHVWAEVDTAAPDVTVEFRVLNDNEEFRPGEPASLTHLETIPMHQGNRKVLGYHIYKKN